MLTVSDIKLYFKNNVTSQAFNDDNNNEDDDLIDTLISDSYSELEPIKEFIPSKTLDSYVKVIVSLALIDRFGVDRSAFIGLDNKAKQIQKLIDNAIMQRMKNNTTKTKTKNLSVKDDSVEIISDSFIQGFIS